MSEFEVDVNAGLGVQFSELAERLNHASGDGFSAASVVSLAVKVVAYASDAHLTLIRRGRRPETIAASGAVAERVDEIQYRSRQGPSLDAAEDNDVVVTHDLIEDERWSVSGPKCVQRTGMRSMLSMRLPRAGSHVAARNFYAPVVQAFDDPDVATASIFAPFPAPAVDREVDDQDVTNLTAALISSRQIGTAVAIIMTRHRVSSSQAFDLLQEASTRSNRKLRAVADQVELAGELPAASPSDESSTSR